MNFPCLHVKQQVSWKIKINNKNLDLTRQVLRYHHYAYRTEQTYCDWIMRYIKFHGGKTHPAQMGKIRIDAFLSNLATHDKVSASTQRQALNAIVFLYRHVIANMGGTHLLMAKILYGCDLRLMECVRIRGKDRTTLFPQAIQTDLQQHLEKVKPLHDEGLGNGYGDVYLPEALAKKYPSASR